MAAPVCPGDVLLGKYRVERVLGQGGMGVVVAARHIDLGELFAVKFLLPTMLAHDEAIERFLREARAAARLRSEHVARVNDVGRMDNGAPYMVMEHLEGSDLKALLRQQGPMPVHVAVAHVLQACDAIAEAHAAGIIHRDLKPANLFLTRRPNGSPCVKVLDFGISKRTGPGEVDLTGTGMLLGSPPYMSPEQMARPKFVDARTDVWSMGVVLYELMLGRVPFGGQSVPEVIAGVLQEDPTSPSLLRAEVPEALSAVVLRALQKGPTERFQTIGELAAALREVMGWSLGAELAGMFPPARSPMQSALGAPPPERAHGAAGGVTLPLGKSASQGAAAMTDPEIATGPRTAPGAATAAAWGKTGAKVSPPSRIKPSIVLGVSLGLAALGGSLWLGLRGFFAQPDAPAAAAMPVSVATSASLPPPPEAKSATNAPSVAPAPVIEARAVETSTPLAAQPAPPSSAASNPPKLVAAPQASAQPAKPQKPAPVRGGSAAPARESLF